MYKKTRWNDNAHVLSRLRTRKETTTDDFYDKSYSVLSEQIPNQTKLKAVASTEVPPKLH